MDDSKTLSEDYDRLPKFDNKNYNSEEEENNEEVKVSQWFEFFDREELNIFLK